MQPMECPVYGGVKKEQEVIDDKVTCFVRESSLGGEAAQPDHSEAVLAFRGSTEEKVRMEHATSSALLNVKKGPVASDLLTLKESEQD